MKQVCNIGVYAAVSEGQSTYADTLPIVVDGNPTLGRVMDPGLFVERFEQEHRLNKVRIHAVSLGGKYLSFHGVLRWWGRAWWASYGPS